MSVLEHRREERKKWVRCLPLFKQQSTLEMQCLERGNLHKQKQIQRSACDVTIERRVRISNI